MLPPALTSSREGVATDSGRMTPAGLCSLICTTLRKRKLDRDHTIAVVAGEHEQQVADAAVRLGILDGYVSVTDSSAGLLVATGASCSDLDEKLDAVIEWIAKRLGGRSIAGGKA